MGITIHYSGNIRHSSLISQMVTEVVDICRSVGWQFHVIRDHPNPLQLQGIHFTPTHCDPIFLTFLPNGRMCSIANLVYKDFYDKHALDPEAIYTASAHTQDAGPATHVAVIKLLRHLEKKYFTSFRLIDESDYWETNDEQTMLQHFKQYDQKAHQVKNMFKHLQQVPVQSLNSLAGRLEGMLVKIKKK